MDTEEIGLLRETQDMFRHANEAFRGVLSGSVREGALIPFVCECSQETCFGRVELTLDEYDEIRLNSPAAYFVAQGHPTAGGDAVLTENERYQLIRRGGA